MHNKRIVTVGDLRRLLEYSDDSESLYMTFRKSGWFGESSVDVEIAGAGSSGGGSITILRLVERNIVA